MNKNQIVGIIFIIVSICCVLGGVIFYSSQAQKIKNSEEVTATVVEIKTRSEEKRENGQIVNKNDKKHYTTFIDFVYDGGQYTHERLEYYQSDWSVGSRIQIYIYDNGDSISILSGQSNKTSLICTSVAALLFLAVGIPALVSGTREKARTNEY